jgi:4-aminobutyrate aminotransferase / (S)-3-amino-2-methylpropionate transaminase / 5-aminovalerate transaminase
MSAVNTVKPSAHFLSGDELPRVSTALPGPLGGGLVEFLSRVECPGLTARRKRREELTGASHDPIVWTAARGAVVRDADGNLFVDMTAGFGAALLGHSHPAIVDAVQTQAATIMHALGDVYPSGSKIALEGLLTRFAPWPSRVILGLSGADAVEAALKSAMLHTKRAGVIAFEGGYHGLSYGALSVCGYKRAFREPFDPQLNPEVRFAPFPDRVIEGASARSLDEVEALLADGTIGAVIVEPIQGRGGVVIPPGGFLRSLGERARRHGAVLIVDEIYTGLYRTGARLRSVDEGCEPDIVCLGKALGGGMPVSACLLREEVARAWGDSVGEAIHTSTFLGNPLASAAAIASLELLDAPETHETIRQTADALAASLDALADDASLAIRRVSRCGLLAGVTLEGGLARSLSVMRAMLERGYIVLPGGVAGDVLTLTPPMCLTRAQLEGFCAALSESLHEVNP